LIGIKRPARMPFSGKQVAVSFVRSLLVDENLIRLHVEARWLAVGLLHRGTAREGYGFDAELG
jgi:hypothetical protein